MKYTMIDGQGFHAGDIILADPPISDVLDEWGCPVLEEGFVAQDCPGGFHRPKWNGTEWVEGLTPEELEDVLNNIRLPDITLEERNRADIEYIAIMTGVDL